MDRNNANNVKLLEWMKDKYRTITQVDKYYSICLNNIIKANEDVEKQVERKIHDTYYSYLLFDYILNIRKTLKQKRILKVMFFTIIMIIFMLTFYCFFSSTRNVADIINTISNKKDSNNETIVIEMITVVVPPLLSLIVSFIKIPEIIAKYLFNIKEDAYMTSIIENLQNYDKSIYSIEKKIEEDLQNTNLDNDGNVRNFPDENVIQDEDAR